MKKEQEGVKLSCKNISFKKKKKILNIIYFNLEGMSK